LSAQSDDSQLPTHKDIAALAALSDDYVSGNCAAAYEHLYGRGASVTSLLRTGLQSSDWQQRLLSAVLFASQSPQNDDFEQVARILIGHLADNSIGGDALLAGHALIKLGPAVQPYLRAAAWHNESQLGEHCRALMELATAGGWGSKRQAWITTALQKPNLALAWTSERTPSPPPLSQALPTREEHLRRCVVDLRSDGWRGNAVRAFDSLRPRGGQANPIDQTLQALLFAGLHDSNRQSRLLCAALLMQHNAAPNATLLAAAIESLKEDEFSGWSTDLVLVANANCAERYLVQHSHEARMFLYNALQSPALGLRLRAAAILAESRDPQTGLYVPLLMDHLRDNNISLDASLASYSLVQLGPNALPWLKETLADDSQQALYLALVERSIRLQEQSPGALVPLIHVGMNMESTRRH
jgi:hypothetical protein